MQYFVSCENTSYFYWQVELLIESFRMKGEESNLLIALAENESAKVGGFSSNLVAHADKFLHPNEGREKGYLPLNRVSAIRYALAYKALRFPFALIHSDMILRRPLDEPSEDYPGVVLNNFEDGIASDEEASKSEIEADIQRLAEERGVEAKDIPVVPFFSAPVIFNKSFEPISEVFFAKLQTNMISLLERRGPSFPCERAAWELTLTESFQHCTMTGRFMAAPLMFESDQANFIHYKTGMPPVFHKRFYRFEEGVSFSGQGPYETLLEHNPTVSTDYAQEVVRSYMDGRMKAFKRRHARQTCRAGDDD